MLKRYRVSTQRRRAVTAFTQGKYADALAGFTRVLDAEGERVGHLYNIGLCYLALEDYSQAETYLLREVELFGEHYPRLKTLGDLYFLWGRREDAGSWYQRAISEDSTGEGFRIVAHRLSVCSDTAAFSIAMESLASYRRGVDAMVAKNGDEALEEFRAAVEQDPSNIYAWNNIGAILLDRGSKTEVEEAIRSFESALEMQEISTFRANLDRARQVYQKLAKKETR